MRADEELHFIIAGLPFVGGLVEDRIICAAIGLIPGTRLKRLQDAVAIPDHRPFDATVDVCVIVEGIDLFDRIGEAGCNDAGLVVLELGRKADVGNLHIRARSDGALEQRFDDEGDGRLRRCAGRGCHCRCFGEDEIGRVDLRAGCG